MRKGRVSPRVVREWARPKKDGLVEGGQEEVTTREARVGESGGTTGERCGGLERRRREEGAQEDRLRRRWWAAEGVSSERRADGVMGVGERVQ